MVPAYFRMLWSEEIPTIEPSPGVSVDVIAGAVDGHVAPAAPPDSWASDPRGDMAIWLIRIEPGSSWTLPAGPDGVNRMLHFFDGATATIAGTAVKVGHGVHLDPAAPVDIENGSDRPNEFLLLQGRPIGAPVFQLGPFVMNTPEELQQAFDDYRRTGFGGWPWSSPDPVHARSDGRFALHADGTVEHREMQDAR